MMKNFTIKLKFWTGFHEENIFMQTEKKNIFNIRSNIYKVLPYGQREELLTCVHKSPSVHMGVRLVSKFSRHLSKTHLRMAPSRVQPSQNKYWYPRDLYRTRHGRFKFFQNGGKFFRDLPGLSDDLSDLFRQSHTPPPLPDCHQRPRSSFQ